MPTRDIGAGRQMPLVVGHKRQKQGLEHLSRPKPLLAAKSRQNRLAQQVWGLGHATRFF